MFPCWSSLALATGSVVLLGTMRPRVRRRRCRLLVLLLRQWWCLSLWLFGQPAWEHMMGAHDKAAHKATCKHVKDALPDWQAMERVRGRCGGRVKTLPRADCHCRQSLDLEPSEEGMAIRKRGRQEEGICLCVGHDSGRLWVDPMATHGSATCDGMAWLLWSEVPS